MQYHVFRGGCGLPRYETSSLSLGDEQEELDIIKEAHAMSPGDALRINEAFYLLTEDGWSFMELNSLEAAGMLKEIA